METTPNQQQQVEEMEMLVEVLDAVLVEVLDAEEEGDIQIVTYRRLKEIRRE